MERGKRGMEEGEGEGSGERGKWRERKNEREGGREIDFQSLFCFWSLKHLNI